MTKVKLNHIDLGGDLCQLPVDTNLYILVLELPDRGKKDKIYLVKDDTALEGNIYTEYSYINGLWESLGLHSSSIDVEVPTKVSLLENDSGFVESASLGTAAYANVEDLQSGGNTCLQMRHSITEDILYDYLSPFYTKKVRLWQAGMTVHGNYSISFEFGEAGSEVVAQGEINNGSANRFVVTQERIAGYVKIELINSFSDEIVYTGYVVDGLTGIYISSSPKYIQIYY